MADLVPFEYNSQRSYDEQMRDALEKALTIQGTVISDLEAAINCIIQMERTLAVLGGESLNPHQATAGYLKAKYGMGKFPGAKSMQETRKLLDVSVVEDKSESLELVAGEVWCDDCHFPVSECACP